MMKTIIDYLLVVIPIVVSVVAIVISLQATRQQNRIALFEKRFSVFCCLQKCAAFDSLLEEAKNPHDAYVAYCSAFGIEQVSLALDDGWAMMEYRRIEEKLMQGYLLFDFIDDESTKKVCVTLLPVLESIEKRVDISTLKELYHAQMSYFYKAIPKAQDMLTLKK